MAMIKMNVNHISDVRRGEVYELKSILNNPRLNKEPLKKREIIKKVIAYMTLGIDVTKLFSEIVMASQTKDLIIKKMTYHYLITNAYLKHDLAILVINTLQKDTKDDDPMIRGLALRSLCSLRINGIAEYVIAPLNSALNDHSGYVRSTAVCGIAKLHHFNAMRNEDSNDVKQFESKLRESLFDTDPTVVINSIQTLNSILEGRLTFDTHLTLSLLNRLSEFSELHQVLILDEITNKYVLQNEDEIFDLMNLLEPRLHHTNAGVVLATAKLYLLLSAQVYQLTRK